MFLLYKTKVKFSTNLCNMYYFIRISNTKSDSTILLVPTKRLPQ